MTVFLNLQECQNCCVLIVSRAAEKFRKQHRAGYCRSSARRTAQSVKTGGLKPDWTTPENQKSVEIRCASAGVLQQQVEPLEKEVCKRLQSQPKVKQRKVLLL